MRPVELAFSGLRSYTEFGPVSFDGKRLVGILGDTGAGKSTILEAICVALYGKCSWSERDVKDLIADGARSMSVDLTFTHDGHRWRVRRTFFANTMPSTHLLENLDTGAKFDNARPVEAAIVGMLRLDFTAFKSAVLLPQGQFQTLLHASGRERAGLLKGLFGADVLDTVRDLVVGRRSQLADLIRDAEVARARLRDDPAAKAEDARAAAESAESRARTLGEAVETLRSAQREATGTDELATALRRSEQLVAEATARLDQARPALAGADTAAASIAAARREAEARERAARARRGQAEKALAAAADAGESPDDLGRADATLSGLPGRLEDLLRLATDADTEGRRLAEEEQRLTEAAASEPALAERARMLTDAATALADRLEAVRGAATDVRDRLREALDAAAAAGAAGHTRARLEAAADAHRQRLPQLAADADAAEDAHSAAVAALGDAQRAEAAATAGAHLHPGDACPLCTTTLPDGWLPPEPADPAALAAAQAEERRTRRAADDAAAAVRDTERAADQLREQAADAAEAEGDARRRAATAAADAIAQAQGAALSDPVPVPDSAPPVELPALPEPVAPRRLQAAVSAALDAAERAAAAGEPAMPVGETVEDLLAGVSGFAAALRTVHAAVDRAASTARDALAAARVEQRTAREVLERDTRTLATVRDRIGKLRAGIAQHVAALPTALATALPGEDLATPVGDRVAALRAALPAAEEVLAARRSVVAAAATALAEAAGDLEQIAADRRDLDTDERDQVTEPLRRLLAAAERAADAVADGWARLNSPASRSVLGAAGTTAPQRVQVPEEPPAPGPAAAGYLAAVTEAATQARAVLDQAALLADEQAGAQLAALRAALLDALPADSGVTAADLPAGPALLDAAALDPLTGAASAADFAARAAREREAAARAEIDRALALDDAIAAGVARRDALEECRTLLADGKFPAYVTTRRTRSLLGVASELFGQLSGEQFGFAEDFSVVSRRTGAARSARTLSGGETFLASLALALALVELYGRTGGRLGALFLDEGFGSLDSTTLDTALSVLRTEAGGDKLVAVISHLHAVAEAVEDVLWVERGPGGSAARWLDPEQTEALVREDIAAGLLALH